MPKRSYEEQIDRYKRKMEKLKDKIRHKRQRVNISVSSSDEENQYEVQGGASTFWDLPVPITAEEEIIPTTGSHEIVPGPVEASGVVETMNETRLESSHDQQNQPEPAIPSLDPVPDTPSFPPLDPDILSALGEATDSGPAWGQNIHDNLAQLWLPLLKKGMARDVKDKIVKQYLIPGNCTLLQAPKLNIEISAAISEMVRLRDKKVETTQQQLGVGIAAISKAMTSLLTNDNKVEAIKTLSDGCRILCDLHYSETQARIKMITPGLVKPFLNVIQDGERDDTLFGVSLPEKIKASKSIEKQGLQIKKIVPPVRPNLAGQNTLPVRHQPGNWPGPSRYPTNRGGRGGQKRFPSSSRRPAPHTSTSTMQSRPNQIRPRAPTRP